MIRILFVCHGNICRSPMAESVCAELIRCRGLQESVQVESAAAHTDEIGNTSHRGTVEQLKIHDVPLIPHRARLMTAQDGERFDYLIGMDEYNVRDMKRIVGAKNSEKVTLLLSFAGLNRAIADPWYTRNFEETYSDVVTGCTALLNEIEKIHLLK